MIAVMKTMVCSENILETLHRSKGKNQLLRTRRKQDKSLTSVSAKHDLDIHSLMITFFFVK